MGELLSAWQAVSRRRARRSAGNTILVQTQPYQNRDRVGEDRIICSGKVQQSFIKQSMIVKDQSVIISVHQGITAV